MLIVEDGTGMPDAESYLAIADADAYHVRMGNDTWASLTDAVKEAMLRRATRYLDGIYGIRTNGRRVTPDQALVFPQNHATYFDGTPIPDGTVPGVYKDAQAEVALLASTGTPLATTVASGPRLQTKKIDVLTKTWFEDSYDAPPIFGWVDAILAPLFGPRAEDEAIQVVGVVRA